MAFLLHPLGAEPTQVDLRRAIWPGPTVAVVAPLEWADLRRRAEWLLPREDLALHLRIDAALAAGLERPAWSAIARTRAGRALDPQTQAVLARWAATRRDQVVPGWRPGSDEGIAVAGVGEDRTRRLRTDAAAARRAVDLLFAALPQPQWVDPLVLVGVPEGEDGPAGVLAEIARPALPVCHLRLPEETDDLRPVLAERLAHLRLDLAAPPEGGWDTWLRAGTAGVCRLRGEGRGPSPRRMHRIRREAGVAAIRHLLAGRSEDRELATAVVAPLLHSHRRERFDDLLETLRAGIDARQALAIAYELTPEKLVEER